VRCCRYHAVDTTTLRDQRARLIERNELTGPQRYWLVVHLRHYEARCGA
jgi:hypothetical protein